MDVVRPELKRRKQRRRWIMVGVAIAFLVALTIAVFALGPTIPTLERDNVLIDTVERGELLRAVRGPGNLVPREIRWITAETDARVERILIRPGATVSADSVILELSNPNVEDVLLAAQSAYVAAESDHIAKRTQLRSDLLQVQSSLAQITSDYESAIVQEEAERIGVEKGVIPLVQHKKSSIAVVQLRNRLRIEQQRVAESQANINAQLAASEVRLEQLANTRQLRQGEADALKVRAGLDGVLQLVPVEEGQRVSSGANLARVARPSALMAELRIAETQAKDLAIGQSASVDTRNGFVDGKVLRIYPGVENGTVQVDVELLGKLPAGARADLSVDGNIEIERLPDVLYVGRPINAQGDTDATVFRLAPSGLAERMAVKFGKDSVNAIQIREGLQAGDRVVLSDMSAYDGYSKVRIE